MRWSDGLGLAAEPSRTTRGAAVPQSSPVMAEARVNGIRLYYEERGRGTPILCIHGGGSTALAWSGYVEELSRLGRIITYDRRGCHRSERPERYLTTIVSEHADDSAALLEVLDAVPAVVIGRSLGGEIAVDLALRQPDHVVALVLLEPGIFTLDPDAEQWGRMLQTRFHDVLERDGMDAGAESFFRMVLSDAGWDALPAGLRQIFVANGPAVLAEMDGEWFRPDEAALALVHQPCLIVSAEESAPAFRRTVDALAHMLPTARVARVPGGHVISPLEPAVLGFLHSVVSRAATSA
jgi:esterase